jgi:hypothetical protein
MEINATTYETIFLLYIDNELSPKERLQVEAWIVENPSYALLMEELKGTLMLPESIRFPNKANLKKRPFAPTKENIDTTEIENLDAIWSATYSNYLMQEMQAMPGLSNEFKKGLKRETPSKAMVLRPFSFNQNKFTYAAVAALLMVFIGYQQLTKTPETYTLAAGKATSVKEAKELTVANTNDLSHIEQAGLPIKNRVPLKRNTLSVATKKVLADNLLIAPSVSTNKVLPMIAYETEVSTEKTAMIQTNEIAATNTEFNILANLNEPSLKATTIEAFNIQASQEVVAEKTETSYEIIDTEEEDRTLYIGNLEIDGNRLRGLKRKVTSLFKNNKSDKNK